MGFRMRKSINLGAGFRINVSKSGIGYSWGVPGYRITKTAKGTTRRTYSLPGTGISYVEETNRRKRPPVNLGNPPVEQPHLEAIESAAIHKFQNMEANQMTKAIQQSLAINGFANILLWGILLMMFSSLFFWMFFIGFLLKIYVTTFGKVNLFYECDEEHIEAHQRRIHSWKTLQSSKKVWQVTQKGITHRAKTNAGAQTIVNRITCRITQKLPLYMRSNVEIIRVSLQKEELIFLPEQVLIRKNNKLGSIPYDQLQITGSAVQFVEDQAVPSDARITGYTWKYVNKNNTPDKRFKDNRQLPICLYEQIHLTSPNGLNVVLQCSNQHNATTFENNMTKE
jgi:hypothetical protein